MRLGKGRFYERLRAAGKAILVQAYEDAGGSSSKAAQALGIGRTHWYKLCDMYEFTPRERRVAQLRVRQYGAPGDCRTRRHRYDDVRSLAAWFCGSRRTPLRSDF